MTLRKKYLVILDLAHPNAEQAKALKADLEQYSLKPPMLVFAASNRLGYFIETTREMREMTFDGNLLSGDSHLLVQLGLYSAVDGFALRELHAWL